MNDPYRDWLRQLLAAEMGHRKADAMIQGAVVGRGWPAMQPFGPREVVAVLQDMYAALTDELGDARADKWIEAATQNLAVLMQTTPAPAEASGPSDRAPQPVRAQVQHRRAHDLPLLLARVHHETAQRSLDAIRVTPELSGLERAAEWDLQATRAELRRWEAEESLANLRAEHARSEMAEQVRSARAQEKLLDLTVRELEGELKNIREPVYSGVPGQPIHPVRTQLSHNRLMLSQTRAFLEVFTPLADEAGADEPPQIPALDLESRRLSISVQQHPNVLRARHALNYAQWQAGEQVYGDPRVREAQEHLARAEAEAAHFIQETLGSAKSHHDQLGALLPRVGELEQQRRQLGNAADARSQARADFEGQQLRAAIRLHSNRLQESLGLLEALGGP
ncbi:hypothetical protein [Deinococcus sp.]|uniref:hypothetical protein n=1 Tax=Deinococcus sp. TaxID=47478 RepID=UPI003CC5D9DF